MEFLIKVIIAWFRRNEVPVMIYGADGAPVASYNVGAKDCWFPHNMKEVSKIGNGWCCYPINLNGEYCGCICWEDTFNDDGNFEKPEFYDILNICNLLEVACEEEEISM